jgi:hypothetical protein
MGPETIKPKEISESRTEELKKLDKFITPQKLDHFWKFINR